MLYEVITVRKEDATVFGMGGAQAGDVVYALKPEYMAEHGYGFPTGESGCGSLKNILLFKGPNIKKNFKYERPRWLADIVPTICYCTGNPIMYGGIGRFFRIMFLPFRSI